MAPATNKGYSNSMELEKFYKQILLYDRTLTPSC
jgi:hypothetical protein